MRVTRRIERLEKARASKRCQLCSNQGRYNFVDLRDTPDRDDSGVDYSGHGCPGCGRLMLIRIVTEDPAS